MRILTLSYEFPPVGGGGAKVASGLALHLSGHEIDLVTMGFQGLPGTETIGGITVYRLPSGRKRSDICHTHEMLPYLVSAFPKVKQLMAERKYHINHTHFIFPDGVLAWMLYRSTGLPYVITAHGSDVPGYNQDRFKFQHSLLAPLWAHVVKNAACVVCPSLHLQGMLLKRNQNVRSVIIPNGMFADKFNPQRQKRMRVLVVTRMFERKGVQYLLEALKDKALDCEINIVGDGPYLDTLKRMAADTHTDIRFHGWLENDSDELRILYETSSIFVFTSQQENFPVNLLEAMAAGMAIIISQDQGSREVVGDTALQVKTGQPEQFFATLQSLVEDPRQCEHLGKRARMRLESHFTWPTIAGKYQSLFDEVLG
jgi:glycosyltransferase involved in cell wall biosynthesis